MIKLTKVINGKKVELDIISLNGKTVIRNKTFNELVKKGITKKDIENAGFGIEGLSKQPIG